MPIHFPISPQLARLESALPRGKGWVYEPKWDGFRAILFKEGRTIRLQSRNGIDLARRFPEINKASSVLPDCVLDGELVVVADGRLEFEGLLARFNGSGSEQAAFIAFDALSFLERDLMPQRFARRRRFLEKVESNPFIQVTPQTSNIEAAGRWLHDSFVLGFEGWLPRKILSHTDLANDAWSR